MDFCRRPPILMSLYLFHPYFYTPLSIIYRREVLSSSGSVEPHSLVVELTLCTCKKRLDDDISYPISVIPFCFFYWFWCPERLLSLVFRVLLCHSYVMILKMFSIPIYGLIFTLFTRWTTRGWLGPVITFFTCWFTGGWSGPLTTLFTLWGSRLLRRP